MRALHWIGGTVVLAGALLLAVSLLPDAAEGSGGNQNGAPVRLRPQGHVYTGVAEEPAGLNPFTVSGQVARRYVLAYTHDTLLDSDPRTGELRPALASAWAMDADGLGFTLTLRRGVVFADGSPVTPEDVLFTWEVSRTEGEILGSMGEGMALVESAELLPGPEPALHVRLSQRHFAALRAVTESWIVTKRAFFLQEVARRAADPESPPAPGDPGFGDVLALVQDSGPGSGPYRLQRWRRGRDLLLTRNEKSWRRQAYPDCWNLAGIRLRFLDPSVMFTALRRREIDWYGRADNKQIWEQNPDLHDDYRRLVYDYRNLGSIMVLWNCRRPALADPRVRRALSMLFDRDTLASLYGDATPAAAVFKRGSPEYPEDLEPVAFDPEAAAGLLAAAGYGAERPLQLRLLAPALGPAIYRQALELVLDPARRLGIEIRAESVEHAVLARIQDDGDWDGILTYMGHRSWIDPYDLFHSGGGGNRMGYGDPEVDALLEQARVELDRQRRAAMYRRLSHLLRRDEPVSLLIHPLASLLFNAHIRDAEPGPLGLHPERFWVPPEHQRPL